MTRNRSTGIPGVKKPPNGASMPNIGLNMRQEYGNRRALTTHTDEVRALSLARARFVSFGIIIAQIPRRQDMTRVISSCEPRHCKRCSKSCHLMLLVTIL